MSDVDSPAPGGVAAAHWQCMGAVLAQRVAVEEVCLYGSRARGTNRPNSDIDLCITASTLDFIGLARLGEALADLGLPWKIDLTLRRTRTPPITAQSAFSLAHQIARYAVPVFVRALER